MNLQRVQVVIRAVALLGCLCIGSCSAQNAIRGEYSASFYEGYFSERYFFKGDGTFSKRVVGDMGISHFGEGEYHLDKDTLVLNFNRTQLKDNSYSRHNSYYNSKDSVSVLLRVFDYANNLLADVSTYCFSTSQEVKTNSSGEAMFIYDKDAQSEILFSVHLNGYQDHRFSLRLDKNYEIDVFLSPSMLYLPHPKAIKNEVLKYKVEELSRDRIVLDKNIILNRIDGKR